MNLSGKSAEQIEKALIGKGRKELIDIICRLATVEQHFKPAEIAARSAMKKRTVLADIHAGKFGREGPQASREPDNGVRERRTGVAPEFSRCRPTHGKGFLASVSGPFFQFPLCALSFPGSEREQLDNIISFVCVEVGKKQWQRFSQIEKDLRREQQPSKIRCTCKIDLADDAHQQAVAGAQQLRVIVRNIHGIVAKHACLTRFIREFERKHGPDAQVRLATNLVFEARDRKGISYAELAVLAAIYSKIGAAKGPVRITRDEIWCRALGCKSKRVFRTEMLDRKASITQRQVRSIIDRLDARKFFARVTYARRQTYYSHRLTVDQLSQCVFSRKMQPALARQARIRANDTLTQRIQAERRRLAAPNAADAAADAAT